MVWSHVYDPLGSQFLSTLLALVPLAVLLGLLAFAGWAAHWTAQAGLTAALAIAVGVVGMPGDAAAAAAVHGAAFGLFPIGWIIVAAMFLYRLCVAAGALDVMKRSVTGLSADHRLQALLIAFCFGAFLEGEAGFGAPVAISAALMCGATFAGVQFVTANFVGAALVDVVGGAVSLAALAGFLRAWTPWAMLLVAVFCWGLPPVKAVLKGRAGPFATAAILPAAAVASRHHWPRSGRCSAACSRTRWRSPS
jgi:L-lactate permease